MVSENPRMAKTSNVRKIADFATAALNGLFAALTFGLLFVAVFKKEWIVAFLAAMESLVKTL